MKTLLCALCFMLLLSGCSLLDSPPANIQRPQTPQPTSLSFPGAPGRIVISPEFKLLGTVPQVTKNGNSASYIYVAGPAERIDRLLVVRHAFLHDTAGLSDNLYETFTDIIERKTTVLPSGPYQFALYRTSGLLRPEQDFLVGKGYAVADRFLAQSLARKLPPEGGPLADVTYVIYLEDITKTDNGFGDRASRAFAIE